MQKSLGGFRAALLIGWLTLSAAGLLYARWKGIPAAAALPLLAAFLLEYSFYLFPGFESARAWLATAVPELQLGLFLGVSALFPYLVYSLPTHQFAWLGLARLAALAFTVSLWYLAMPRAPWSDMLFLALLAAALLRRFFDPIFTSPMPSLHVEILGQLALIHLAICAILLLRRVNTVFGFLPTRREWAVGCQYFAYFLPIGVSGALLSHMVRWNAAGFVWWKALGTFLGVLWVVALSEEFFFRGLLQNWLSEWTRSTAAALALTSIVFGLCHLGFRGFPNWRMALIAAAAGYFYGSAFQRTGNFRAGMVSHALVVTFWRSLFS